MLHNAETEKQKYRSENRLLYMRGGMSVFHKRVFRTMLTGGEQ